MPRCPGSGRRPVHQSEVSMSSPPITAHLAGLVPVEREVGRRQHQRHDGAVRGKGADLMARVQVPDLRITVPQF